MQGYDWNDLRVVLAVERAGGLAGAGRLLGVDETTVARRLRRLERDLGVTLFVRAAGNRFEPTDVGLRVLERAELVESESRAIAEVAGQQKDTLRGTVRLTSTPMIVNRFLAPRLGTFRERAPGVCIELIPEARNLDLSRREADIAVRFARPTTGGLQVRARRVGAMRWAAFEATRRSGSVEWIGYVEEKSHLPQARWTQEAAFVRDEPLSPVRVADAQTALEMTAEGLGQSLLPFAVAAGDGRLARVSVNGELSQGAPDDWVREVWAIVLADERARASVRVALDWLSGLDWDAA